MQKCRSYFLSLSILLGAGAAFTTVAYVVERSVATAAAPVTSRIPDATAETTQDEVLKKGEDTFFVNCGGFF